MLAELKEAEPPDAGGGVTEEEKIVQDDAQTQAPDQFQELQPESSQLAADIDETEEQAEVVEVSDVARAVTLGKPHNLTATDIQSKSMLLSWTMTSSYNLIKGYRVYYAHNNFLDVKTFEGQKPQYKLTGLKPYTRYVIHVTPFGENDIEGEPSNNTAVTTDTDEPSAPYITNATCYESMKIYLEWKRPTIYYRSVDYYYIYYKPAQSATFKFHKIQGSADDDQKFFLEEGTSHLKSSQQYQIKICAGTKSIKTSEEYEGEASDEVTVYLSTDGCEFQQPVGGLSSEMSIGILVGAVTALFLLLVSLLSFIVWKKHCDSAYCYLEDPPKIIPPGGIPDWEGEPGPDGEDGPINVADFTAHVAKLHADSDIGFSREYNEILRYSADSVNATSEHSSHPDNKHKNRYLNIVAYDHSRVQLSVLPGQKKTTDYINSNYIDGFQKFQAYIGSQGPLDDTFESFWRMVWEQRVYVIVMITNLVERGRRKCDMYWPKEGTNSYGQIDVSMIKEEVRANFTLRVMKVKHRKLKKKKWICSERTVNQFHFTGWPDHGTPADTLPVLSFIRKSIAANPEDGGPIIAHCSAGVGRTGTYIVIDAMMKQAAAKNEMNIFGFLKHIRSQRNHLVQTEEQYIFLHDALIEALASGQTEVGLERISEYISDLTSSLSGLDTLTLLEHQYNNVVAFTPADYDIVAARQEYNEDKNRSADLVPIECAKVVLTPKPCIEGSDYINASWLQGFEKLKEFILTQHPTAWTKEAFWSMLWDHNAQTVVLLSPVDGQDLPVFWPGQGEEYDQESFRVRFIEEQLHEGHSTLDFVVSSSYDDYELKVRMIKCAGWPHTSSPLYKVLDVINLVQEWHLEYQNGPLVVVDRMGGTEAATFCALTTLKKQIECEGRVDVYQTCKLIHNKRPGIWRSQDDYLYIYRVLESLAGCIEGENANGIISDSENLIERRHSSLYSTEWRGSDNNIRITLNRRHSLPSDPLANGKLSNKGSECVLEILNRDKEEEEDQQDKNPSIISIGQESNPATGSTAILVSEELVQVSSPT